jgi:hypothetical protein
MQPSQAESFGDSEMRLAEMARLTGAPTRAVKQKRNPTPVSDLLDASGVFLGVGKGETRGFGPLDLILLVDGVGLLKIWQIALGRAGSDLTRHSASGARTSFSLVAPGRDRLLGMVGIACIRGEQLVSSNACVKVSLRGIFPQRVVMSWLSPFAVVPVRQGGRIVTEALRR